MAFQSEKTGRYLRAQTIGAGAEERARAVEALRHGYGVGNQAALASLLLATLGGSTTMGENVAVEDGKPWVRDTLASVTMRKVAQPMQASANDLSHDSIKVVSAS